MRVLGPGAGKPHSTRRWLIAIVVAGVAVALMAALGVVVFRASSPAAAPIVTDRP
jgi:hypothetical protein